MNPDLKEKLLNEITSCSDVLLMEAASFCTLDKGELYH